MVDETRRNNALSLQEAHQTIKCEGYSKYGIHAEIKKVETLNGLLLKKLIT